MKSIKSLYILLLSAASFLMIQDVKAQPEVSVDVNFNTFYNDLQPYGRWIDHPTYGRVWIYDEPGFRPYYTNGHWEYSNYGWSWISDYNWGWAPFHYGRWEEDPEFGWLWIPGYEWAPAWVSWSEDDDNYGWAPLGYGWDISFSIGRIPSDRWCFLPRQYITYPHFYSYCIPFERNRYIARNARFINNFYEGRSGRYLMGPGRGEVERITHSRIESHRFTNQERFGGSDRRTGWSNQNNRNQRNEGYDRNQRNDAYDRNVNRNSDQQREDSRQRVFGDRNVRNERQYPQNNGGYNNNNTNMYDRRQQRVYNQPQVQPERQQQSVPYRQQPQRQYNFQQNNRQERSSERRDFQQQPREQRNNDRQDSRSRVFGDHRRG